MFEWRITKYDPQFRDASGAFQKDEWTSISDIGEFYSGREFSFDEYMFVENAYVNAILLFMDCMKLTSLHLVSVEKYVSRKNFNAHEKDMLKVFTEIKNNQNITKEVIPTVCRLILREKMWCKLEAQDMFVHFGYDYYMYVGVSQKNVAKPNHKYANQDFLLSLLNLPSKFLIQTANLIFKIYQ